MAFMANQRGYVPLGRASSFVLGATFGCAHGNEKTQLDAATPSRENRCVFVLLWHGCQCGVRALHTGKTPHGTVKFARNSASCSLHRDPFGCGVLVPALTSRRAAEKDEVRAEGRKPTRSSRCFSQQHSRRRLYESTKICRGPEIF